MTFTKGKNTEALTKYVNQYGPNTTEIHFQDGPIIEFGVNGVTNEQIITMLIDRLNSLNNMYDKKFACRENSLAITKLEEALMWLERRTANRVARGVEGTNTP